MKQHSTARPRHRAVAVGGVVAFSLLAAACGSDKEPTSTTTGGTTAGTTGGSTASTTGGSTASTAKATTTTSLGTPGGTFRWAFAVGPDVDDMVNIQTNYRCSSACVSLFPTIFDPLVEADPVSLKVHGILAEKWEVNSDATVYTFFLRKDAKFHDGTPVTAEDVAFSYDRVCNAPELKPQSAFGCSVRSAVKTVEVIDPTTVKMTMNAPTPDFLVESASAAAYLGIVPKAAVLKVGQKEFGEKPIGTGPFKFVEWVKGDHITVERNPDYKWGPAYTKTAGGPPLIEKIIFKYIPDPQTRINALKSGEVDGIDQPAAADQAELASDPKYRVTVAKYNGAPGYIYLNTQSTGPTSDVNVRKAISAAIDRDAINKSLFAGLGVPTEMFLTEGLEYNDPVGKAPAYNLAESKKFLAAAGYTIGSDGWATKNGQRLKLRGTTVTQNQKLYELIQAQLKLAGMELEVTPRAAAELTSLKNNGTQSGANSPYDLWTSAAIGFGNRTAKVLNSLFSTTQLPPGWNPSWYADPAFETPFQESQKSADPVVRARAYKEALTVLANTVPAVPIIRIDRAFITTAKFTGVEAEAAGAYRKFWDVRQVG